MQHHTQGATTLAVSARERKRDSERKRESQGGGRERAREEG
jgi:hypothetical protein